MRKQLALWELGGFLFTAALGTALHFTYGWSGGNLLAAAFSAVNESVWEHMKLLFFPAFLWSVGQVCFLGRNYPNFLAARALSVLVGTALVPVLYFTYTGIAGTHVLWADIAVFLLADLGLFWLDFRLLRRGRLTGAGAGAGGAVGPGLFVRVVHLPAAPPGPVAGYGGGGVRTAMSGTGGLGCRFFLFTIIFQARRLDRNWRRGV